MGNWDSTHRRPLGNGIEHTSERSYPRGKEARVFILQISSSLKAVPRDIDLLVLPAFPEERSPQTRNSELLHFNAVGKDRKGGC